MMRPWRRFFPLFFFALIAVIPLWHAIVGGQAIGPFDQVRQMAPWNGPAPAQPWDVLQADGVLQFYPWRHLVFDAWSKGQLPLWNPYELAGTPLLANSQSAGFYPLHVLVGILRLPTAPAMTFLAWFHLMWAGLGTYSLSRKLGAGRLGALVGGSSFAISPYMLDWTALPSVITTAAWIPWVLGCVVNVLRPFPTSDLLTINRGHYRNAAGLAVAVAMMALAGHLQIFAYGLMSATLMAVGLALVGQSPVAGNEEGAPTRKATSWAQVVACVVGIGLGLALAAPQLLPVLEYGKLSPRQNKPTAEGYSRYTDGAMKPFELANLTVPNALGSPREAGGTYQGHTLSAYWPMWVKQGANYAESAITISPLILGLLFLAPWKRRDLWPLAAVAVIALLLALGTPLNALLYFGVPNWSATGSPARVLVLFVLGACVLGAMGVDRILSLNPRKRMAFLAAPLTLGLLFAIAFPNLAPDAGGASEVVSALRGSATGSAAITILTSSILAAIALALTLFPEAKKYRLALAVFPIVIAWTGYASNLVSTGEPLPISDLPVNQSRVAVVNTGYGIPWVPTTIFPPNTASLSHQHELGGYDSLLHRDTVKLLNEIDGGKDPAPPEVGNMMFLKPNFDVKKLADAGVSQVLSRQPIDGLGTPQDQGGYLAYDVAGPGRISAVDGTATITDDGYDHQTIEVTQGTKQVTERDRLMPGWIDSRTGAPVQGDLWRTIQIAPGQTKVSLRYDPPGLRLGLIVCGIAWIVALVFLRHTRK